MIPLVLCFFSPWTFDSYVLPKIALASVLVFLTGMLRGFRVKSLTIPLAIMLASVCVSGALSGDALVNLFGRYCSRYLAVLPLIVCFWAYHLPLSKPDLHMRWAGGLLAACGLSQLVWNPLGYQVLSDGHRIIGAMGSPPALGCALVMCLPFCYGKSPARALLTALVMAATIATGSRGCLLAAAVSALVLKTGNPGHRASKSAFWSFLAALVCYDLLRGPGSDQIRWLTWIDSVKLWWAHPIFGVGAESYVDYWRVFHNVEWLKVVGSSMTYQDHAHNDFLEALAAFGIIGLIAYCNLLWRVWKSDLDRVTLASLLAVFICAKFNAVPFAVLFVMAILLGAREEGFEPPWMDNLAPRVSFLGLTFVLCWCFFVDSRFMPARRNLDFAGIVEATERNPAEIFYQAHEADLLTRKWFEDRNPELLERALQISRKALAAHPISVQARHMITQTLLFLAQTDPGYLAEAQESAKKLVQLDPVLNYQFRIVTK